MKAKGNDGFIEELRHIFVSFDIFNLNMKSLSDRISPLEKIGYGVVTLIVTAVFMAVMALVIKGK